MRMAQAIMIAEAKFGAWVENDQLYFPTWHAKERWEDQIRRHDDAIAAESKSGFTFNNKRWYGTSAGDWK